MSKSQEKEKTTEADSSDTRLLVLVDFKIIDECAQVTRGRDGENWWKYGEFHQRTGIYKIESNTKI